MPSSARMTAALALALRMLLSMFSPCFELAHPCHPPAEADGRRAHSSNATIDLCLAFLTFTSSTRH